MIAFVVNGDERSAMGERARAFAGHLRDRWPIEIAYRVPGHAAGTSAFVRWLLPRRPRLAWVFDMGLAGVLATALARVRGTRMVVDTGDAITALARQGGLRGPIGIAATAALERFAPAAASAIVVRGTAHRAWFAARGIDATVIPDGVEVEEFQPLPDVSALRRELRLDDAFVVGIVGSSMWSSTLQIAYGWDLVEALGQIADTRVVGLLVGDGTGVPHLRARAEALGVLDRLRFVGRQPYQKLAEYLALCDVCLSTQTNDLVGSVRTTGKLPLYMASGRYVLASRVGEAARVLPDEMLVPYEGTLDRSYPDRLASRIAALASDPARLRAGDALVDIARREFAYSVLAERVDGVVGRCLGAAVRE